MWRLLWSESAKKDLKKLDPYIAKTIITKTASALDGIANPLSILVPLKYGLSGQYKFRIGNYRVICILIHDELFILAVSTSHRKDVYEE
ncbi:MAG: type II toxin-antitoxin system RelE/ParE family toxin [Firmicutes bacterium HGW-Firmicutes-20]|jgi:mRNA interferase RelE/StbE|nr:MAG: type II toxin-antitoxin system RelE/ParE family toxin [Firmicutes bacterium HGW-Firmicutes-20]PKM69800.1 MAG: type II toxin-antitoxin system RelE/ParE family toxin [Firmicutes bacterium HGW-Firmicutes-19]